MNQIVEERSIVSESEIIKNLESIINEKIKSLQKIADEKKKHVEMLNDGVNNNPTYRENAEKAKDASKVKAVTKQQIMSQPSMIAIHVKVKELTRDLKETRFELSDYLLEYERLTKATQLELFDGQMVEIVKSAKIVRRK